MTNDPSSSFLTEAELNRVGFASLGTGVRLSRFARIYRPERIALGSEIRIDDFALISPGDGWIVLEGYNHLAAASLVFGTVTMRPWSTLSSRSAVYARSDDFTFDATTYPHGSQDTRRVIDMPVTIGSRVVIGTGSTVLPGSDIHDGISVGAMSLVNHPLVAPGIYAGIPARFLRPRSVR